MTRLDARNIGRVPVSTRNMLEARGLTKYYSAITGVHMLWALCLSAFFTYTFTSAELERQLMQEFGAAGIANAAGVFLAIALALWARRKLKVRTWQDVPFEADMPEDQMFQGFNLSEIQAAQAVATPRDHRNT